MSEAHFTSYQKKIHNGDAAFAHVKNETKLKKILVVTYVTEVVVELGDTKRAT